MREIGGKTVEVHDFGHKRRRDYDITDPAVIEVDRRFYMVSTSHVLPAFPIRVSSDLVRWEHTGRHVFTSENRPRWADDHFWAPEVHRAPGGFIAYYTARARRTNRLCIGAALAPTVLGPYEDLGRPLIEDRVSVLDATSFEDRDGARYLYWKADAAIGDPGGPIYAQRVASDSLALLGSRTAVLTNDLAWEHPLIEGPWLLRRGESCYLFYSGGRYDTPGYAVGVARSRSPSTSRPGSTSSSATSPRSRTAPSKATTNSACAPRSR